MDTSKAAEWLAVQIIKQLEGFSPTAYRDAHGYSIGYGFFGAGKNDTITLEEAEQKLLQEVNVRKRRVLAMVSVPLTATQLAALISFHYNVGEGQFNGSTLLRKLNMGDYASVPSELRRWVESTDPNVRLSLTARREQEINLWSTFLWKLPNQF